MKKQWLWEFSKIVVIMCAISYFLMLIYTLIIIAISQDLTPIPTMIEQCTDVMRTCVFGYCIEAGAENMIKIYQNQKKGRNEENDEY